jgi:hypothetical protein
MPPTQPQSPSPDFDFMLKQNAQPKRSFSMPNVPKPLKIAGLVVTGIILLIIVLSLFSGGGGSKPMVGAVARAQETIRVTAIAQQLSLRDPQTQALAATVNSALLSDKQQLVGYLVKNHVKVSTVELAANTDKSNDASLQAAAQNNGLDAAYIAYLKTALAKYQSDLQVAFKSTGPNGKVIINNSFESTRALLNSSPIKS